MKGIEDGQLRDDAVDAAQFLLRLAYAVIALAAPVGVVMHPLAIYMLLPIGASLIVLAAALDLPPLASARLSNGYSSPLMWMILCLLAWAAISLLWTPFRVEGGQQMLRCTGFLIGLTCVLTLTREKARATDLYFFPIGVLLAMVAVLVAWIASNQGMKVDFERIDRGGTLIAALLFPAMGGLAARTRTGWARIMMVLAFVYVFAIGSSATMIALFAGLAVVSFAVSDLNRTARDLSWIAAALIGLTPLLVLVAAPVLHWILRAKLAALPPPYPQLDFAFQAVTVDWPRLITGHGFETLTHGVRIGALPPETPTNALFQVWYELGIVGAWLAAAAAWLAFRAIGAMPPRFAPYAAAGLAVALALSFTRYNLDDWTWLMTLAIAVVAGDVAQRSQYRTTRLTVENIPHY